MSTHSHPVLPAPAHAAQAADTPITQAAMDRFARWRMHAPLTLASIALALLAVVPICVHWYMGTRLDAIAAVLEPARGAVNDMQVALAVEAAGTRGFLLTGDERDTLTHREARLRRQRAYSTLLDYATRIRPDLRLEVAAMEGQLGPADALLDGLFSGKLSRDRYLLSLAAQHARLTQVLQTTSWIERQISVEDGVRRSEIHAAQRLGTIATLIGIAFALPAIVSVARLSQKHLVLAERAEKARADEERGRQELFRVSASRERLIRGFSHDLLNPLNAADGYLFMLQQEAAGPLTPGQTRHLQKARRSLGSAIKLSGDMLALARAESGQVPVHRAQIDLGEIVTQAVDDLRAQADAKSVRVSIDIARELPPLRSDAVKVSQILGNLVSNAIKYTDIGEINVCVATRADERGAERAVIDVSDTGVGIRRDDQGVIFNEFERLDTAAGAEGAGIGLAISQRLAHRLGGALTVESEPGRGSTFTLWLPLDTGLDGAVNAPVTDTGRE
jgi:signal transduction histidine kinase